MARLVHADSLRLALETETDDPQRIAVSQHDWAGVTVLGPDRDAASAGDQDCAI